MERVRRQIHLRGRVQGVGLRPWAARRARELGLAGFARNTGDGLEVVVEGREELVERWIERLLRDPPSGASVEEMRVRAVPPSGARAFRIEPSASGSGQPPARIPRDAPICAACTAELFDPRDRRYRHPFLHCAECGPRASVLHGLPYDRERTTLGAFPPCPACQAEYEDPRERRYHAQTIACPRCGPRLVATEADGRATDGDPIEIAAARLRSGGIVALKGYGGFHLAVDANRPEAVARLRKRKHRPAKPFAVLVPDLGTARRLAVLGPPDEALLAGPERAVLVAPRRRAACARLGLADEVAPHTDDLGLLLPCAPLHWLLLFAPGSHPERGAPRFGALVLTSANRSGEPTLHDDAEALRQLAGIADLVVGHDRGVTRPNDDPVFRSSAAGPIPIRLSRATAPRALALPAAAAPAPPVLALGGDLKCAPALAVGGEVLLLEHVGDLGSADAADALVARVEDACRLLGVQPAVVAHDLHPAGVAGALAERFARRRIAVQHHHAHAAACLVEHGRAGPALALALDGLGYGSDGAAWGGELLRVELAGFERLGHLEMVSLPGGDAAAREPWRMAAAWLARAFPEGAPRLPWHARRDPARLQLVEGLVRRGLRSPPTSSCGRLFDAVASLLDVADENTHEGEAAMGLESLAAEVPVEAAPRLAGCEPAPASGRGAVPLADLVRALVEERARGCPPAVLARAFHEALATRLADAAIAAGHAGGLGEAVLTGGCFQNRLLLEGVRGRLTAAGVTPLVHRITPPGDGGLAVGQAAVAAAQLRSARMSSAYSARDRSPT
jgi:hydrogenase maturation protein HypF